MINDFIALSNVSSDAFYTSAHHVLFITAHGAMLFWKVVL